MFFASLVALVALAHDTAHIVPQAPPFAAPTLLHTDWMVDADVAAGDLNGDGVPDLIHANPGVAMGANRVAFRARLLEDDSSGLSPCAGAAPAGRVTLSCTARAVAGDFDEDGFDDVVALTYGLGLSFEHNTGQSQSVSGFASSALIDDLGQRFTYVWPTTLRVPVFLAEDLDGDGHLDLVVGVSLVDYGTRTFSTPGLFAYFGNGDGTFAAACPHPLPSAPIDADWIDRDGDGRGETLLCLGQNAAYGGAVTTDVTWFAVNSRTLVATAAPQVVAQPDYATSVAYMPDPARPSVGWLLITGHSQPLSYEMHPEVRLVPVDVLGGLGSAVSLALPASLANDPQADLQAGKVLDFDGDGVSDFVALVASRTANAGLLLAAGPIDQFGVHGGASLLDLSIAARVENGPPAGGPGQAMGWQPNVSSPDCVRVVDLDSDQRPDLLVGGLVDSVPTMRFATAAVFNTSQPTTPSQGGHLRRVRQGRPTAAGATVRCGARGGEPVIGNADFAISMNNGPRDALVTLMAGAPSYEYAWGPLPLAATPDFFGGLRWLHAPVDGATRTTHPLPIPQNTNLVGYEARFQWLVFDPNSTDPFPFYCSETLEVRVGVR